ncbi:methyl-accepting chemotaxis protein [Acidovorax carolinensis]|uniref:Methyl-accepting chemotaxis protein n=1 Tax=Acidovorax carolinensis TaxID=553814 RepID=A0A240UG04_9BURK|nr:methyl-accepting chemotaxis protein [Acidovorax carolinensis]ART59940.1 methyl-accepting chemotaxis protein [Acidovorax carolinensis]
MQLDNIRVSRKLWGAFIGLMIAMLIMSGWAQNRGNNSMTSAMDAVVEIEGRIVSAVRWRGATETAVTMVMGSAVTSDAVLAQQYDARVKEIIGGITKIQESIVASATAPQEKASLDKVLEARKAVLAATAKTREVKSAGDTEATRKYADNEFAPLVATYLKAQDDFVQTLEQRREQVRTDAFNRRVQYAITGLLLSALLLAVGLAMAWQLVRSITRPLDEAVAAIDAIAAGDLTRELQSSRQDEFGHMLRSLSAMSTRLRGVVTDVRAGVDSVSSASVEIANGNHDLSARTEQTASNLEETAASMEQLTATVTQSADTARQANQLAGTAAQAAARGGEVVGQVVASMQQITDSSRKISDIIGVIDGIAFQTNILALNAAVEAARAGEQGRGFAVVASEVRSLAQRSAEAAKEIKTLISASVENVESGSTQVAQAGQSMQEIVNSVQRVSDLIGEITASSTEQRDGIAQVNQAVTNLDQMTQQNAALVEESTAAAASMRDQAQHLAEVVSAFNVGAVLARAPVAPRPAPAVAARRPAPAPVRVASAPAAKPVARLASVAPAAPKAAAAKPVAPAPRAVAAGGDDDWESF